MNRRGFFALLGAAFAGLRWSSPLAPPAAAAALRFHKGAFVLAWPRIGDTIIVRKPIRFIARDGLRL